MKLVGARLASFWKAVGTEIMCLSNEGIYSIEAAGSSHFASRWTNEPTRRGHQLGRPGIEPLPASKGKNSYSHILLHI